MIRHIIFLGLSFLSSQILFSQIENNLAMEYYTKKYYSGGIHSIDSLQLSQDEKFAHSNLKKNSDEHNNIVSFLDSEN